MKRTCGVPATFRCPWARSKEASGQEHVVVLTGRKRPYKPRRAGIERGKRSDTTEREYRCSCRHVGWSSHIDLVKLEAS